MAITNYLNSKNTTYALALSAGAATGLCYLLYNQSNPSTQIATKILSTNSAAIFPDFCKDGSYGLMQLASKYPDLAQKYSINLLTTATAVCSQSVQPSQSISFDNSVVEPIKEENEPLIEGNDLFEDVNIGSLKNNETLNVEKSNELPQNSSFIEDNIATISNVAIATFGTIMVTGYGAILALAVFSS